MPTYRKLLIGKSTNTNLGHSGGKYGMWCTRGGLSSNNHTYNRHDITTCTKDQLCFSTDTFGNASGAIDAGQYQVMPTSGTVADVAISVSGGSTATLTWTDLDIDLIWAMSFNAGQGVTSSPSNDSYTNAQNYGTNQTSTTISNTGSATRTTRDVAVRGMKTGGLW